MDIDEGTLFMIWTKDSKAGSVKVCSSRPIHTCIYRKSCGEWQPWQVYPLSYLQCHSLHPGFYFLPYEKGEAVYVNLPLLFLVLSAPADHRLRIRERPWGHRRMRERVTWSECEPGKMVKVAAIRNLYRRPQKTLRFSLKCHLSLSHSWSHRETSYVVENSYLASHVRKNLGSPWHITWKTIQRNYHKK